MEYIKDDDVIMRLKNQDLIRLCSESKGEVIWYNRYGAKVIRLSTGVAVKFGLGVNKQEAMNQEYVHRNIDGRKLRVPKVFRFFEDSSLGAPLIVGYLVMEFIEGIDLAKMAVPEQCRYLDQIAAALDALSEIPVPKNAVPGPIGGGGARGYLWPDCGVQFSSTADLEHWLNQRLLVSPKFGYEALDQFHLKEVKLTLCHMDIAPRNILATTDGKICFVDWAFTGMFPRFFQDYQLYACRECDDPEFFKALINELSLPHTIDKSQQHLWRLGVVQSISTRVSFESSFPETHSPRPWVARQIPMLLRHGLYSIIARIRRKLASMWKKPYHIAPAPPPPPPAPPPPPKTRPSFPPLRG